jgi:hypothetical protein
MATQQITPTPRRMQMPDELRTIAEHVLLEARIAIEKAVAHSEASDTYPLSSRGDEPTLEHTLTDRLNELPASQRKRAQARVMPSERSDAATRARRYGELARIDLRSATPIAVQAAMLSTGITLSPQTLSATAGVETENAAC